MKNTNEAEDIREVCRNDSEQTSMTKEPKEGQENEEPSMLEKVADVIIEAVWMKNAKRFLDDEVKEDLLTYEESEKRLIFIGLFSAILLALGSSIMLIFHGTDTKIHVNVRNLLNAHEFQFPVPLVGILERDGNGLLKVFTLTKYETLVEFWSIDLPDQKYRKDAFGNDHEDKYLAYAERKSLLVASGDASKDMITVHANKSHRIIPNSKIPHPIIGTQFVRVGNYFWIFGGFDPFHYLGHYTVPSNITLIFDMVHFQAKMD